MEKRNFRESEVRMSYAAPNHHGVSQAMRTFQRKSTDRSPVINPNQSKDSGKTAGMKSTYFDRDGTWHHIYPRELLKNSITSIKASLTGNDSKPPIPSSIGVAVTRGSATWGAAKSKNYYWHPGNGFAGVLNALRTDDPGNNVEPTAPASMGAGAFQAAVNWGNAVHNFAVTLSGVEEGKRTKSPTVRAAKKTVDSEAKNLGSAPFHSLDADWTPNGDRYHL